MSDGGKGSTQRPRSVSGEEWAARWDAIFQRDLPERHAAAMEKAKEKVAAFDRELIQQVRPSLIEGIMSTETCEHPFCDCKDVCKEAK